MCIFSMSPGHGHGIKFHMSTIKLTCIIGIIDTDRTLPLKVRPEAFPLELGFHSNLLGKFGFYMYNYL
jgi:hypothetical protein